MGWGQGGMGCFRPWTIPSDRPNYLPERPDYPQGRPDHLPELPNHPQERPDYPQGWPNHLPERPNHPQELPNHPQERPDYLQGRPNYLQGWPNHLQERPQEWVGRACNVAHPAEQKKAPTIKPETRLEYIHTFHTSFQNLGGLSRNLRWRLINNER